MSINTINTPQPHYVPGYTGHVPGYTFRIGDTYGSLTHKVLLDPSINHSDVLVLSERNVTDFEVQRPKKAVIDILSSRKQTRDVKYEHPIVPSYNGFVPMENGKSGQRFAVQAEEGMAEFEAQQRKKVAAENALLREVETQSAKWDANVGERQMVKTEFRLPLLEVRPELSGVLRNVAVAEPAGAEEDDSSSPYFMQVLNPEKYFIPGYQGHIPYGHSKYGKGYTPYSNSALCDFTANYRRQLSTEWAPVSVARRDPPLEIKPTEIYHKNIGMLPDYAGHVPGSKFRAGQTFGNDTRDAKRWLSGDYSL